MPARDLQRLQIRSPYHSLSNLAWQVRQARERRCEASRCFVRVRERGAGARGQHGLRAMGSCVEDDVHRAGASRVSDRLEHAVMVGGALDADALDARLYGGASAAVSALRATSYERLARLEARRNPWEPSGVAMPRAQIVRLSFADSGD